MNVLLQPVPPLAAAAALVLGFALLRVAAFSATALLVRAQLYATACLLLADALLAPHGLRAPAMVAAGAIAAATGLAGRAFLALDRRTGIPARQPSPIETVASVIAGLVAVVLAALLLGRAAGRPATLGLATALLGLLLAARRGSHVVQLLRLAVLGNGLAIAAASIPDAAPGLPVVPVLIAPALLLAAEVTLARAGGIPASDPGG